MFSCIFDAQNLAKNEEKISALQSELLVKNALLAENLDLKQLLLRSENEISKPLVSAVLVRPPRILYDTLIIDVGYKDNVKVGMLVFVLGDIAIGNIESVSENSSRVRLFSSPSTKNSFLLSSTAGTIVDVTAEGRGNGEFGIVLPRTVAVEMGAELLTTGIKPHVVAIVGDIKREETSAFATILARAPFSISMLRYVVVDLATHIIE